MSTTPSIPDELVLAAIERAALHSVIDTREVPVWAITAHLHIPRRSRRVRSQLASLEQAGALERSRRHGIPTWVLTSAGRRRLQRARRTDSLPALPESPQHREWRDARTAAARELGRFERSVSSGLAEAAQLLKADPPASSDAWFALGERLQRACRRLGSASYCLREWAEPADAHPDIDEHLDPSDESLDPDEQARRRARRAGRRNVHLWNDRTTTPEGK
jgi:hypothetical protein